MDTGYSKQEEQEIDGDTYRVTLMSVSQAIDMGDKLMKLAAPVLEAGPSLNMDAEVSMKLVIDYVAKAASKFNSKQLLALMKEAMPFIEVQRAGEAAPLALKVAFETHFQGRFDVLVKVMKFFLAAQYGSFSKLLPQDGKTEAAA